MRSVLFYSCALIISNQNNFPYPLQSLPLFDDLITGVKASDNLSLT